MKIEQEGRMTIRHLCGKGVSNREVARLLGVSEGAVRYHRSRQLDGGVDGRSRQPHLAEGWREAIAHYVASLGQEGPINLATLHEWLVTEHDYPEVGGRCSDTFASNFPAAQACPAPCGDASRRSSSG